MLILPAIVYYLYFCVAFNGGGMIPGRHADWHGFLGAIRPTVGALVAYPAWMIFQALLFLVLPGRTVEGLPLKDGSRLRYRLNGLAALIVTLVALGAAQA